MEPLGIANGPCIELSLFQTFSDRTLPKWIKRNDFVGSPWPFPKPLSFPSNVYSVSRCIHTDLLSARYRKLYDFFKLYIIYIDTRPAFIHKPLGLQQKSRATQFPMSTLGSAGRQRAKVSQLVPKHRWDATKVASCMGQFLQVRFVQMPFDHSWGG